ncbi:MAG: hypothetical protein QOG58_108 [Caballeronia sp.]|jgi:hypothetical protein|nr:hypothetical protein [Caballeronia sp.]
MRVLYVIGNLGDYHVPRYEALLDLASMRGDDVYLVEIFGKSSFMLFLKTVARIFLSGRLPDL